MASGSARDMAKFTPREGWVCQAYRFALDPTSGQEQMLRSHAGAPRAVADQGFGTTRRMLGYGLALGRDINAAANLLKLALGTASGAGTSPGDRTNACGAQVRLASGRRQAASQEPGVPDGSKTGTAARQLAAAK